MAASRRFAVHSGGPHGEEIGGEIGGVIGGPIIASACVVCHGPAKRQTT